MAIVVYRHLVRHLITSAHLIAFEHLELKVARVLRGYLAHAQVVGTRVNGVEPVLLLYALRVRLALAVRPFANVRSG